MAQGDGASRGRGRGRGRRGGPPPSNNPTPPTDDVPDPSLHVNVPMVPPGLSKRQVRARARVPGGVTW